MMQKSLVTNRSIWLILFVLLQFTSAKLGAKELIVPEEEVLSEQTLHHLQQEEPYSSYLEVEDNSFSLSTLKKWIVLLFSKLFGNKASFHFTQALPYLIVVVTFVLIVMKVAGLSFSDIRKPKLKSIDNTNGIFGDDDAIGKVKFENFIAAAISDFDFRLAIRYSYLQLLQQLDERELIIWEKQKSNFDYLLQLKSQHFYNQFIDATRTFEDAWYGEMPWSNDEYKIKCDNLKVEISDILKQIQSK